MVKTPMFDWVMGGGTVSTERRKILDKQRERTPPWGSLGKGVPSTR
jgi:hypothetical protein